SDLVTFTITRGSISKVPTFASDGTRLTQRSVRSTHSPRSVVRPINSPHAVSGCVALACCHTESATRVAIRRLTSGPPVWPWTARCAWSSSAPAAVLLRSGSRSCYALIRAVPLASSRVRHTHSPGLPSSDRGWEPVGFRTSAAIVGFAHAMAVHPVRPLGTDDVGTTATETAIKSFRHDSRNGYGFRS